MLQEKLAFFSFTLLILGSHCLQAQYFSNPSFEGPPAMSVAPPDWYACNQYSTPDTHPGQGDWSASIPASEGNTYLGLVTRGSFSAENDYTTEAAGTKLNKVLKEGICYTLTLDLVFNSTLTFTTILGPIDYGNPEYLLVWAGNSSCEKEQLLWKSPLITNVEWKAYSFYFTPEKDYSYFILEADYQDRNNKQYGNISVDNIQMAKGKLDLGSDRAICNYSEITLGILNIDGEILWNTGSTSPMITVANAGLYWAQLSVPGCILRDTISIENSKTFSVNLGNDASLCMGDTLTIGPKIQGNVFNYQWSNGSSASEISIYEPGVYEVIVDDGCESHTDAINISYREICCGLTAPTVFTPNEDGLNDTFKVTTEASLLNYELKIYNRWGQQVFKSNDPNESWPGKIHGQDASTGVYFWISNIVCSMQKESENKTVKGEVSLIR